MSSELNQFRDTFFEESYEHLAKMESSLLALETGSDSAELLKIIFRAAHTIKGGAGMFGLDALARFTHAMESLLDRMRNGQILPSPPLVDLLLRCGDTLKGLLEAARVDGPAPEGIEATIGDLERALESGGAPEPLAEPAAVLTPPEANPVHSWRVRFTPETLRNGFEPLLVLRELTSLGTLSDLELDTSSVLSLEDLDPGVCHLGWHFRLTTSATAGELEDVFAFVEKGSEYSLALENAPPHLAYPKNFEKQLETLSDHPQTPYIAAPPPVSAALPAAERHPAAKGRVPAVIGESTIRVDVALLDRLMNVVGELVLARNQILQFASTSRHASLNAASQRLNLITSELQEGVMKTRMQPIGTVWGVMPRLVRDLAAGCGKRIRLETEGAETELDRTLLEAIKDPLTHIVRNACDHGIERPEIREQLGKPGEGRIHLRAYHEGGHVIVEITDDGAGIDPARIRAKAIERGLLSSDQAARMNDRDLQQLVFHPGFSTAEQVTDISGRGVGMDVVKTNVDKIGGAIDLSSRPGQGAVVRLKIPLTLAIIPGLVVTAGGERFIIPQMSLLELLRLEGESGFKQIEYVHQSPFYRRRGALLPLVYLTDTLGLPERSSQSLVNIVVVQAEQKAFGLVVDAIHDTQEIVVKPLGKQLKGLGCYSGSTIMGDGRVSLILDVIGIAQQSSLLSNDNRAAAQAASPAGLASVSGDRQTLLLFRSASFERLAVPLALVARLEEFPQARVERSGRGIVVQYRERILPLTSLGEVLGQPCPSELAAEPLPVIVFANGEAGAGLIVEEILDVVEEQVGFRKSCDRPGFLGSAVVEGRVTDFLDVGMVLEAAGAGLSRPAPRHSGCVLLADPSAFHRALLRNDLETAGYRVLEASNMAEAAEKLQHGVDVFTADIEFTDAATSSPGGRPLRQQAADRGIAVLRLSPTPQTASQNNPDTPWKFDRASMLRSLERLFKAIDNSVPSTATAELSRLPEAAGPVGRV